MMELFRHELYKVFGRKTVWIGLIFVIVLITFSAYMQVSQSTEKFGNAREYYNSFYLGKEGNISSENKQSANNWLKENLTSYNLKAASGQISVEENQTIFFNIQVAKPGTLADQIADKIVSLNDAIKTNPAGFQTRSDTMQVKMLEKLKVQGLYFTLPLENILIFSYGLGFVAMGILVLLGISPVFSEEYVSNMDILILSSKKGRRSVVTAKVLSTAVYCIFIAAVVLLVNFLIQTVMLGMHGWNAPLQLSGSFSDSPFSLTYGGYIILQAAISAVACVFFGIFVLFVSSVSSNVLIPFFLCGFLFSAAAFVKSLGAAAPEALITFSDFSYAELMRVDGLIKSYKAFNFFGYPILYPNLILGIYVIITAIIICLTYGIFKKRQVK